MQVGIDVGATKIESVVLEENGQEKHRSRTSCPKDYLSIVNAIKAISQKLEKEFKMELPIGCLLYTSPSPRDYGTSRMPSSA